MLGKQDLNSGSKVQLQMRKEDQKGERRTSGELCHSAEDHDIWDLKDPDLVGLLMSEPAETSARPHTARANQPTSPAASRPPGFRSNHCHQHEHI